MQESRQQAVSNQRRLWRRSARSFFILGALLSATVARADDNDGPKTDKSVFTLLNPTPDANLRDFNPDRPTRITAPYTIDAGRLEIESDFASLQHSNNAGVRQDAFQLLDPTIKLGLLSNVDVELGLNGLDVVRQAQAGATQTLRGFGDVYLRAKVNFIGNDSGDFALAAIPYVKLPSDTAASLAIGNDAVEGGALLTGLIKLPQDFQLGLQTELDLLQGGNDTQRHPNFVNIATLSHEVPGVKNLTAYGEIYTSISQDKFTPDVYTADFALSYLLNPNLQLDGGVNIGLNKDAPRYQLYAGIARRF